MNQVNYNHTKTWLPILVLVPLAGFSQSSCHNSRVSVTQVSLITFNKVAIRIFPNGYYVDQKSIFLDGISLGLKRSAKRCP